MKYLVGTHEGKNGVYVVTDEVAYDITAQVGSDLSKLASGEAAVVQVPVDAPRLKLGDITPALPIARPGKIICLGLNYVEHIKEGGYDIPDYPALFMRGLDSLMAAGQPMIRPGCSDKLDYEAELMIIIGKGGRHISAETALEHVFGYTVFNDGSVRDYQRKTHQWTPGKNFDSTGAVGPFVVTPEDLPEGAAGLKIESRVGDEILQSSNTRNMIWSVAQTIAIISEYATLNSGDMIALGTPPGVGHAKTPPRWLRPGETVEVEIEGIGICASPVADETNLPA